MQLLYTEIYTVIQHTQLTSANVTRKCRQCAKICIKCQTIGKLLTATTSEQNTYTHSTAVCTSSCLSAYVRNVADNAIYGNRIDVLNNNEPKVAATTSWSAGKIALFGDEQNCLLNMRWIGMVSIKHVIFHQLCASYDPYVVLMRAVCLYAQLNYCCVFICVKTCIEILFASKHSWSITMLISNFTNLLW